MLFLLTVLLRLLLFYDGWLSLLAHVVNDFDVVACLLLLLFALLLFGLLALAVAVPHLVASAGHPAN